MSPSRSSLAGTSPVAPSPLAAAPDAGAASAGPGVRRPEIEQLRLALAHMSGAERRLRGRDHKRPGELTIAQVRSLTALGRDGEMTAGQLARSADLNPATVTAMLDQLEEAGVVKRERSTSDRRVCNVSLTPAGEELVARKQAAWHGLWEDHFAGVPEEDLRTTMRVIAQITGLYDSIVDRLDAQTGSGDAPGQVGAAGRDAA